MSQAGEIDVLGNHPEIPTEFIANSGTAIPIANTIELLGAVVAAGANPFRSIASGNTVTYQVQYASASPTSNPLLAGIASFDSASFAVDANGFVTLTSSGAPVLSVSGTANRITSTGGQNPIIDISAAYVGQTSITTLGTITTGVWNGTAVNETHGGTNQTTYAAGDLLYASAINTLSKLAATTNGFVLTLSAGLPVWSAAAAGTVTSVSGTVNRITSTGGATPVIDISASYVGQTSITTLGTIATGVWNGTAVDATHGGTNQTTYATGDILYASGVNTLAKLAAGSNTQVLTLAGGVPTWASPTTGTVTSVTGTANQVAVANGTTTPVISLIGPYTPATYTAHGVLIGEGTSSIVALAAGSSGQVLQSGGASSDPSYSTATFPSTATGTGKVLVADGTNWVASTPTFPNASATSGKIIQSDGTNWVASTNTYPNTATTGDILYASATNVIGFLADVAVGQVLISGGVGAVPAYSATPTVTSITFGSGTALSQYVQGTFTPTIDNSTGSPTVTYTSQIGRYTRIGNRVFVVIILVLNTYTAGTGNVQLKTLPYTSEATTSNIGVVTLATVTFGAAVLYYNSVVGNNATLVTIQGMRTGLGGLNLDAAGPAAGATIRISLSYEV